MTCLNATFTLTPKSPWYHPIFSSWQCSLVCYGADFLTFSPYDFSSLYSANCFYFDTTTAADPTIDYSQFANRMRVPFIELYAELWWGTAKQLALIFGFQAATNGRVLVYTDAGLISNQTLAPTDNQFLLEIDSLASPFHLYFIHAGGSWSFTGLSGYMV
jgi:hypothetical protein